MPRILYVMTLAITIQGVRTHYGGHFRGLGWQVDGMASGVTDVPECREAFDRVFEIDWSRNPLNLRNVTTAVRKVRRVVYEGEDDIVHVHTPVAGFATRFALRNRNRSNRPTVIYGTHGFHFSPGGTRLKNAAFLRLEKIAGRWTDYLIVVNNTEEQAAHEHSLVPEDRIHNVPGTGMNLSSDRADSVPVSEIERLRRELGMQTSEQLLAMIAEFNVGKRHRDAVYAFCRSECANLHLAFAGTGPTEASVRRQVTELGDIHNLMRLHEQLYTGILGGRACTAAA